MEKVLHELQELVTRFDAQSTLLVGKVCEAIEAKAFNAGQVTSDWLKSILEENKNTTIEEILERLRGMLTHLQPGMEGEGVNISCI